MAYGDIHRIGEAILVARVGLAPDVDMVIRHYLTIVERHIMPDSRVAQLVQKIYAKHRRALDLIFEARPDDQLRVHDRFIELLKAEGDPLVIVNDSKSYVTFVPRKWLDVPILAEGGDETWTKSKVLLRFELRFQAHLSLHLLIGPGSPAVRSALFEATGQPEKKSIFRGRRKALGAKWTQIWSRPIKKNPWESDVEDVVEALETEWKKFTREEWLSLSNAILEIGEALNPGG